MQPKAKHICKKILHNPFFIALLLTVLAMIIIVATFKNYNYGGASNIFKIGFYMFICFSIILLVNNMFLKKTMESTQIKTEVKEVFTGIDMSKEMSHDIIQIEPNLYEEKYSTIYEQKNNKFITSIGGRDRYTNAENTESTESTQSTENTQSTQSTENTESTENTVNNIESTVNNIETNTENTQSAGNIIGGANIYETDVNSILDSIVKIDTSS
jgi:ABC-type cobalt transport system substrate-binding protein